MGLNKTSGNMYTWITHTWNTIKGACPHDCHYCYMKRFGLQRNVRFDNSELKTDLGEGNFIFIGSSCDMFAMEIPGDWILKTLDKASMFENEYLFQSKNPQRMAYYTDHIPVGAGVCTTIETNRIYYGCKAPSPSYRSRGMELLSGFPRYVTIEPIMEFDLTPLVDLIKRCEPLQVNIGADSGGNGLPEPSSAKIFALEEALSKFSQVKRKRNLSRLLTEPKSAFEITPAE